MLRLSGRRVPFCCGKNRVRRAAAVQTVQNRLPRACGEKPASVAPSPPASGSPPRVRGEAVGAGRRRQGRRITPACAGRSGIDTPNTLENEDHPRVCGEKWMEIPSDPPESGSPPRVRGEGCPVATGKRCPGITPACAGRSYSSIENGTRGKDHPRVCGEKLQSPAV